MARKMSKNPRPYGKNDYIKNSRETDQFKLGKQMLSEKEFSRERIEMIKGWTTLYRIYPSVFIEHYLGIQLYEYQRYWLDLMARSTNFMAVASRASAKSFISSLFMVSKCILYPGTICTVSSGTKKQAGLIISEKIGWMMNQSPNLSREVKDKVMNSNEYRVTFHNGSSIEVVVSGENARGRRNSLALYDERRLIPNEVIDNILRPFAVSRRPGFSFKKEYLHVPPEEPIEIQITSSYIKQHEWFKECQKLFKMMADGDPDVNVLTLDYLISIKHGTKTVKQMEKEKVKLDPLSFDMEYGNLCPGGGNSSLYKFSMFPRTIKRAWRPMLDKFATAQKNPYDIKKKTDEKRVLSCDLAMRSGSSNDLTVMTLARLFPTKKGWETDIVYQETHSGRNAMSQALRIKQIAEEADVDVIVLDVASGGGGLPVFDILSLPTKDENRMREYDAYGVIPHFSIEKSLLEDMQNRTLGKDVKQIIYPISATPQLNAQMSIKLRDRLKRKLISFLCDDAIAEEYLISSGNKDIFDEDGEMKSYLLSPHVNTSLMINECISLEVIPNSSGSFRLQEPSGGRKDRFSSLEYLNWYVSYMDAEIMKEGSDQSDFETLASLTFVM